MPRAEPIPDEARDAVRNRDGSRCVRCKSYAPFGHWHHRRTRSVRDGSEHSAANGIWLCPSCHAWVHAHPSEAQLSGWVVSRWADPMQVPVEHARFGTVLLTPHGGVIPLVTKRTEQPE
jgi:hypothetical protein